MMIGFFVLGKIIWVEKFKVSKFEKMYNIFGTNFIIDKMKVCVLV